MPWSQKPQLPLGVEWCLNKRPVPKPAKYAPLGGTSAPMSSGSRSEWGGLLRALYRVPVHTEWGSAILSTLQYRCTVRTKCSPPRLD
jgi:hypothetical protein